MVAVGSTDKVDALSGFDADLAAYLVHRRGRTHHARSRQPLATASEISTSYVRFEGVSALDAAGGDARLALAWALEDLIRTEQALEAARRLISYGYARGGHSTAQKEP